MKAAAKEILAQLQEMHNTKALEAMERFALPTVNAIGIKIPVLRKTAKAIGKNHELALQLWKTKNYEARIIAALINEPSKVTEQQMEEWVNDFDNWAICDCCCGELFDKTRFAPDKAFVWSYSGKEYIKRAGFSLMAAMAVHDKQANDKFFFPFLKRIEDEAYDERNFVRKAVNWALRQIGKRNIKLHAMAITSAMRIHKQPHKSARWIAADALRELQNEKMIERIKNKLK